MILSLLDTLVIWLTVGLFKENQDYCRHSRNLTGPPGLQTVELNRDDTQPLGHTRNLVNCWYLKKIRIIGDIAVI
jgi:hypothetical protein